VSPLAQIRGARVRPHNSAPWIVLVFMNSILRRILLGLLAIIGAFVGLWAAAFPQAFYLSFPGLGLHWISSDGPFNEHLIRDVGGLYLGFAAAAIAAIVSRSAVPGRVVGIGWALFGLLHLSYHLAHPEGAPPDQFVAVAGLAGSLLLGVILTLPGRRVNAVPAREAAR
jgi:hypothetical protein